MSRIRRIIKRMMRLPSVIIDPTNNSCTLNGSALGLLNKAVMAEPRKDLGRVVGLRVGGMYGFMVDPKDFSDVPSRCFASIQQDGKTGDIGFYMQEPDAVRVLHDYGCSVTEPRRLTLRAKKTGEGETIFLYEK